VMFVGKIERILLAQERRWLIRCDEITTLMVENHRLLRFLFRDESVSVMRDYKV